MPFETEPEYLKEEIRQELIELSKNYTAGDEASFEVAEKIFTGIAAPFGAGKTTITNAIARFKPEMVPINTITTRHRKISEDPVGFKTADEGVTFASMLQAARQQELINFSVIPGGDVYGTLPEGFPGEYNIGPFLPNSIKQIEGAGFKNTLFAYIVLPGELWRGFVEKSRRNLPENKFQIRINETFDSVDYALHHLETLTFVENQPGEEGVLRAAKEIRNMTTMNFPPSLPTEKAAKYLLEMQAVAKDLALH